MKEALCRAFCNDLKLTEVPAGFAVTTTFVRDDGDSVGFYIVRDRLKNGLFRLEDDGTTVPFLEAAGVEFSTSARSEAFTTLLETHGVEFDEEEMLLHTGALEEAQLPAAAMRFVSLLMRMSDFLLLTQEKIASHFREDAVRLIKERMDGRAEVHEGKEVSSALRENVPDLLLKANDRNPVAVFFGTSPQRVYEAILLQMQALYETSEEVSVITLLEHDNVINRELRKKAGNRLTAVASFRGDEIAAIDRIDREATGRVHHTVH